MIFFLTLQKGEESYPTSDMSEGFVKVIFLCNSFASCNNKHQNSLCYKFCIHSLSKCGKHEVGRHYRELKELKGTTGSSERCAQRFAHDELFADEALLLHINAMELQNRFCAHPLCPSPNRVTVQILLHLQLL